MKKRKTVLPFKTPLSAKPNSTPPHHLLATVKLAFSRRDPPLESHHHTTLLKRFAFKISSSEMLHTHI
ncbi:unnamed protein product [Lupinus luteus]|uniref:Uncharacterized protein n=1 Tax=Lupinus luteus TaxID=3873 RepID=A0AAV1YIQ1_LUPLU